ncbi:MAG: PD-(D/E)XK nuclease family protein [Candidatus Lindowbacteria bacterium]|nr:PD-(D/E)XK nuclease family protein [Candidatus Lindowbacteria bacterium]
MHESLSAGNLIFSEVVEKYSSLRSEFGDAARWNVLTELFDVYQATLSSAELSDKHLNRREALSAGNLSCAGDLVLLGCADINAVVSAMIRNVAENSNVHILVHAPESESSSFDDIGAVIASAWIDRKIELGSADLQIVDRPDDQVVAVLRSINTASPNSADEITIGLGDEALGSRLSRLLAIKGVTARLPQGKKVLDSGPGLFVSALRDFVGSRSMSAFAALVRHPDVERYLDEIHDCPAALDNYLSRTLQQNLDGEWIGKYGAEIKEIFDACSEILPADASKKRELGEWAEVLLSSLQELYKDFSFNLDIPEHAETVRAIEAILSVVQMLRDCGTAGLQALTKDGKADYGMTLALLLDELSGMALPEETFQESIECLGWLELQLDDAPQLIITAMNEGNIPSSRNEHIFLPDSMRRGLGLPCNRSRYARDVMTLTAILNSRPDVTLISGRRSSSEDPLTPSRLLLATRGKELAERVLEFYKAEVESTGDPKSDWLGGDKSEFAIPLPIADPVDELRVTSFGDYLDCPYRFWLNKILKLRSSGEGEPELDPMGFGTLTHSVLEMYGNEEIQKSVDPKEVAEFLNERLDQKLLSSYGKNPPPAVFIQIDLLKQRLDRLSLWLTDQVTQGWSIKETELEVEHVFMVDGEPFKVTGHIDRIDQHENGQWRILDYKTNEGAPTPRQNHKKNKEEWKDLQLPLYREISLLNNIVENPAAYPLELGYVNIPRDLDNVGLTLADWTDEEYTDALGVFEDVVRSLRSCEFWPLNTGQLRYFGDDFEEICMVNYMNRWEAIARVENELKKVNVK